MISKYRFLFSLLAISYLNVLGQIPEHFNYQLMVRDGAANIVSNKTVSLRINILQGTTNSNAIYQEEFSIRTNLYGQLNVPVGSGNSTIGAFKNISWDTPPYYIKAEYDIEGGSNFNISQTSSLNSLPYAMHSAIAKGVKAISLTERDKITNPERGQLIFCFNCSPNGEFEYYNGSNWVNALGGNTGDVQINIQTISIAVKDLNTLNYKPDSNTLPLEPIISPIDATNKNLTWTVNDTSIAQIDSNGNLKFSSEGQITVTATAQDSGHASATLTLNFVSKKPDNEPSTGIQIYGDSLLMINDYKSYYGIWEPFGLEDSLAIWKSLDTAIFSISVNGTGFAKQQGSTQLVVTSSDNLSHTDTLSITVSVLQDTIDREPPILTIDGYDGDSAVKIQRLTGSSFPAGDAIDSVAGVVPVLISSDTTYNSKSFTDSLIETFRIIYYAEDTSGNSITDSILVEIVDELPPNIVITANLNSGDSIYFSNKHPSILPTAVAFDDDSTELLVNIDSSNVIKNIAGDYVLFYQAQDLEGNIQKDSLHVFISDSLSPVISTTPSYEIGDTIRIIQGDTLFVPSAIGVDENGDTLPVVINDNGFEIGKAGTFEINYTTKDLAGNISNFNLIIISKDTTPPQILNKASLNLLVSSVPNAGTYLDSVIALDNVGVDHFQIYEIDEQGDSIKPNTDAYYESWMGGGGALTVNGNGVLSVHKGAGNFPFDYYFRIIVWDHAGLSDTTDFTFKYEDGKLYDLRAKQMETANWVQVLGSPFNTYTININIDDVEIGDTLGIFTSENSGSAVLDTILLNSGPGSQDFNWTNIGKKYYLTLASTIDTTVIKNYELNFDLKEKTVGTLTPFKVRINAKSFRELSPTIAEIFPDHTNGSFSLRDLLFNSNTISTLACPLDYATGIFGNMADGLDVLVTSLPVIPSDTSREAAKLLVQQMPAYFYVYKDGPLTRINLKIPVKSKTLTIEYIIDNAQNGCYWVALLDKLKPSGVSSRISFLDNNTVAGVVVNTLPVTEKSFEFVKIPKLNLNPGGHLIAVARPVQNFSAGMASAILNPEAYVRISPLAAGWSDPNLEMTMGLNAEFKTEFEQELINRLDLASSAAQTSISAARTTFNTASNEARKAAGKVESLLSQIAYYNQIIKPIQSKVGALQSKVGNLGSQGTNMANQISTLLLTDEICTPGICITPCAYPSACSYSCGFFTCYFPCVVNCGCLVRAPELCVPNPINAALANDLTGDLWPIRQALNYAQYELNKATSKLNAYLSSKNSFEAALLVAQDALNTANAAKSQAESALNQANIDAGKLGKVANFVLDNFINATLATGNATFETTVASAENGSFEGTLSFNVTLLGKYSGTVTLPTFSFNGNQIDAGIDAVVNQIIDLIP